jgi:hypothetical protein
MTRASFELRFARALGVLVLAALFFAAGARADTTFGGDPTQTPIAGANCSLGAPLYPPQLGPYPESLGQTSCMWGWSNPAVGSDIAPIPATGGSGTVTSVTLPAMVNPGPMQVVVLTAALAAGSEPSKPDYVCCQVKQVGPTFEVPANRIATVPQSLHVSATETADLSKPGDTSFGDLLGVSVLSPTASLPIRYTGEVGEKSPTNFDGVYAYYPAPAGPNGEYKSPFNVYGFQMLASFTFAGASAPAPGPAPIPGPAPGGGGLHLSHGPLLVGPDGRTLTLGNATNPPIARTVQTLTAPTGPARAAAVGSKAKKGAVYGKATTTVAAGKTVPLKLRLNARARSLLAARGSLRAVLTVVSTTTAGGKQSTSQPLKVKPAKPKKKR